MRTCLHYWLFQEANSSHGHDWSWWSWGLKRVQVLTQWPTTIWLKRALTWQAFQSTEDILLSALCSHQTRPIFFYELYPPPQRMRYHHNCWDWHFPNSRPFRTSNQLSERDLRTHRTNTYTILAPAKKWPLITSWYKSKAHSHGTELPILQEGTTGKTHVMSVLKDNRVVLIL